MLHDLGGASTLKVKGSFLKKLRYCRMSCLRRVHPEARFSTEGLDTIRHAESSRSPSGMSLLVRVSPMRLVTVRSDQACVDIRLILVRTSTPQRSCRYERDLSAYRDGGATYNPRILEFCNHLKRSANDLSSGLFAGVLDPRFCTTEAFDINRDVVASENSQATQLP